MALEGFSFKGLLKPEPPPVPENSLDKVGTWDLDPGQAATWRPPDPAETMAALVEQLGRLVDHLTPGVPGIEGAEPWPEVVFESFTVATDTVYTIPGNARRSSLLVYNEDTANTVYWVPAGATDTTLGQPIPPGAEREIQATYPVRLLANGSACSCRTVEQSS